MGMTHDSKINFWNQLIYDFHKYFVLLQNSILN